MKVPTYSLRVLLLAFLVLAMSLAALRYPTEHVAFYFGLLVTFMILGAIPLALGCSRSSRIASISFLICTLLILYLNDSKREALSVLPAYNAAAAEWMNERFGWAERKGPPNSWVYWARGDRIFFESFDASGSPRSRGSMTRERAELLEIKVDLANLPEEPPTYPSQLALREIVALASAVTGGLLAALLAHRISERERLATAQA